MMVIYTASGSSYTVTNEQGAIALQIMGTNKVLHLKQQKAAIKGTGIMEVSEATLQKLKSGEWVCKYGAVHRFGNICYHGGLKESALQLGRSIKLTPEQEDEEHSRRRRQMDVLRQQLKERLGWK